MKKFNLTFVFIMLLSININAEYALSVEEYNEIKSSIESLDKDELIKKETELKQEIAEVQLEQENTQSPSKRKLNESRLSKLFAELSEVQKALLAFASALALDAVIDDDDSNPDLVAPSIGIIGDNPATVELGTTYSDAGAFANDAVDGTVNVTSSSTVNTSLVGS